MPAVTTTRDAATELPEAEPARPLVVAGRRLQPTEVFDTYWRFAAARQAVYDARLLGSPGPWTEDPILQRHRFTNCFRAADRVSQFLIKEVSYTGSQDLDEIFFRTVLFKSFNKIQTWQLLAAELGEVSWATYDFNRFNQILARAFDQRVRLYSGAYVVPPPALGESRKHANHLRLIELMMSDGAPRRVGRARSMRSAFEALRGYPAMGNFLAYQHLIDLGYSSTVGFEESEYVVAGPGACDGIRKCFGPSSAGIESEIIRYMADHQTEHFARLGLRFTGLRGRALQLVDCQNLFCEVDKYARVAHPDVAGVSGRTRIKQKFRAVTEAVPAWFPPKWGLNDVERSSA